MNSAAENEFTLALIGAGNMGGALLGGWLANGIAGRRITVVDPAPRENLADMVEALGVHHVDHARNAAAADVLVVAVKPQILAQALADARRLAGPQTVTVSVAAGKSIAAIAEALGAPSAAIVRTMPNTPALVQRGITVACANSRVSPEQKNRVDRLLRAVGSVEWIEDESLLDAVTAISGSGPAYVFHLAECMAQAGIAEGLAPELAMKLARETVSGAGELMAKSKETAERLRQNVTSPNGTTAAALSALMGKGGMAELVRKAVAAAAARSRELG
jgi:pyrroline-5-carboxylate reductase